MELTCFRHESAPSFAPACDRSPPPQEGSPQGHGNDNGNDGRTSNPRITMPATLPPGAENSGDLWVFGYGSLMWRPGFDFVERLPGRLIGEHRSLCVYSFVHRGTPEQPGLVLGLDHGGTCDGIAYRVAAKNRIATITYLREREQVTAVYHEVIRPVLLENGTRSVNALTYVADHDHVQYAGRLSPAEQLSRVLQGQGQSGSNRDYVLSTVKAIEAEGFHDEDLHQLMLALSADHQ